MKIIQKIQQIIADRLDGLRFGKAKENSESGRSMVEMLGVLAIIGILTIGALIGYNYAMKVYRVNEIIETMNRQTVLASAAKAVGVDLPEKDWMTTAGGFEMEYSPTYTEDGVEYDNFFTITIKDVPSDLLEMLIKKEGGKAYQILIDGIPIDDYDFKNYRRKEQAFLDNLPLIKTARADDGHDVTMVYEDDGKTEEGGSCRCGRYIEKFHECRPPDNACEEECSPDGIQVCKSINSAMKCVGGKWKESVCSDFCSDGKCTDRCSNEGARRCGGRGSDMGFIEVCDKGGWHIVEFCGPSGEKPCHYCDNGFCVEREGEECVKHCSCAADDYHCEKKGLVCVEEKTEIGYDCHCAERCGDSHCDPNKCETCSYDSVLPKCIGCSKGKICDNGVCVDDNCNGNDCECGCDENGDCIKKVTNYIGDCCDTAYGERCPTEPSPLRHCAE